MGSFVLDLVFIEQMSSSKGEETIALLVIFLLWRVLRLVNGRPIQHIPRRRSYCLCLPGGVDPYGTGGTRPPNIWNGGHYHECPPQYL